LVETWHDDAHSPDLIACVPPGFTLIERARPRNDDLSLLTNHGGVCLLCDASLHAREIPLPVFSSFEVVGAYIHRSGLSAVLVVVYRTGNVTQAFYDQVSDLLERLATFSASMIVVGDFNIHVDDPTDADANKFADILSCNGLQQHVTSPTHCLGHTLDLFITRPELSVHMLPVDPPLLSDHSFLVADVVCPQQPVVDMPSCSRLTRYWRSLDVEAFAADLMRSDLAVNPPDDVTAAFDCYDATLRSLLDKHVPLQPTRVRARPSARWYDGECRSMKRATRRLERLYRRLHTPESLSAWRDQFDQQRHLYQTKFTAFWSDTVSACRNNPRALWKALNSLLKPPQQNGSTKLSVDDFAAFFRDKVEKIRQSTGTAEPPVISERSTSGFSLFAPATVTEISALLNNASSKSCDLDPIPTWLLKRLSVQVAPIICHLCNLSLSSGVFPHRLKQARVLPLLKKPSLNPDLASSYRPISNLSFISKLVERVVAKRFTSYVATASLFPSQQSAYRAYHSTETAVLSVHNDLVCATDRGHVSSLMLLDLSAAFDTVDHKLLLTVLASRFCVHDVALNWFRSYLSDRHQTFHFSGKASAEYPVDCSVPQGSVLGPIGFISYTEDVADVIHRHDVQSHFYADDMQLYVSCHPDNINDVRLQLSACAADVSKWCASRRLQMNSDKTEIVWFGSRAQLAKLAVHDCSLQIGAETVQPASAARVLGVLLDSELTMKSHIAGTASACFYHLRRLRQIRRRVGEDVAVRLVLALITSRLDYCNSCLAGLPKSALDPLQRVQNAAARLIFQLGPRDHVTPSLSSIGCQFA
jgi:hypothetical protein